MFSGALRDCITTRGAFGAGYSSRNAWQRGNLTRPDAARGNLEGPQSLAWTIRGCASIVQASRGAALALERTIFVADVSSGAMKRRRGDVPPLLPPGVVVPTSVSPQTRRLVAVRATVARETSSAVPRVRGQM